MYAAVEIVEVGPRDGLQNEATLLPTDAKVELVRRAVAAGHPPDRGGRASSTRGGCRRWPTPRR